MIISRTPFRVSFMGGGTDLPSFYEQEGGAVISTSVDKYIHLMVNARFDATFRLSYSKTEICDRLDKIEHPIFRAVLEQFAPNESGLELISMGDIPAGTGLGSSSSFTVGLIHALTAYQKKVISRDKLAADACHIEIDLLKEPIGKQDQYAAAKGGLQFIQFLPSGDVVAETVRCTDSVRQDLESSLVFFFTGMSRNASKILSEQKQNTKSKFDVLREMKQGAFAFRKVLETGGSMADAGGILHEGWQLKRSLASGVTSDSINDWYDRGRKAGAWGGKLLGAGGGGFLMFMCPADKRSNLIDSLPELRQFDMKFESKGSHIIFAE